MNKEEYAELHYLLGKYKYSLGEMIASNIKNGKQINQYNDLIDKINDILRFCIIMDNKEKRLELISSLFYFTI